MGHQVLESEHKPANEAYGHKNQPMSSFSLTGHEATVSLFPPDLFSEQGQAVRALRGGIYIEIDRDKIIIRPYNSS